MVQCTHDGAATNVQRRWEQHLLIKEELVRPNIPTKEEQPIISVCSMTPTVTYS